MDELIARLEAAGPSLEHVLLYDVLKMARNRGWISESIYERATRYRYNGAHENAALMLLPEGYEVSDATWHEDGKAWVSVSEIPPMFSAEGKTFPLALCIAALKARSKTDK